MGRNRTLGSPYEQAVVTASFNTEPHIDRYLVTTPGSGPNVVVTLDPNAYNGDQVVIFDASLNASAHPIVVSASAGQTIFGDNTIESDGDSILLTFSSELAGWTVEWGSSEEAAALTPNFQSKIIAAGTVVTAGDDITAPVTIEVVGSSIVTTVNLQVSAWASYHYTPGVVTPVIVVSQNGGGPAVIFAFAQSALGENDISMSSVLNIAISPGANTFIFAFQTSGGDAAITLGHATTGFSAGLTVTALP